MSLLSFDNLSAHFGEVVAWHCLVEIEKAAGIASCQSFDLPPETRLLNALRAQDNAQRRMAA